MEEDSGVKKKLTSGCGEEEGMHFFKMFNELCKQIRNMDGLPLKINSIHGIDAAFTLTDVRLFFSFVRFCFYVSRNIPKPRTNFRRSPICFS